MCRAMVLAAVLAMGCSSEPSERSDQDFYEDCLLVMAGATAADAGEPLTRMGILELRAVTPKLAESKWLQPIAELCDDLTRVRQRKP